jgi:hypothetical protein
MDVLILAQEPEMLRIRTWRLVRSSCVAILALLLAVSIVQARSADDYEPVVDEFLGLMESRPDLQASVEAAIEKAALQDIRDMDGFAEYLDDLVTLVPTEREVVPEALKFYYIVNQAPGDALNEDEQFNAWMKDLVQAWGSFLDTPASAAGIDTFVEATNYNIDDYIEGPSGWQTFNQFFAREVKSGRRPITEPRNDRVIVSPADAVFMGQWPIDQDSNITVKGVNWAIAELLDGSPYKDAFEGGIYTHSFLYIDDYHRYHVPVAGTVKEVRNISGKVYMDVFREVQPGTWPRRDRFTGSRPGCGTTDRHGLRIVRQPDDGSRCGATQGRPVRLFHVRRFRHRHGVPGQGRRPRCRGRQEIPAGAETGRTEVSQVALAQSTQCLA